MMKNEQFFSVETALLLMMLIVIASNYFVQFPINDWLTYGAFTYPLSFLITELTNGLHGPKKARKIVYAGFVLGAIISSFLAPMRIAAASGIAFLISQLLDIYVFNRLRRSAWWAAPFFASAIASLVDTVLFWGIAMGEKDLPVLTWAAGDFFVKLAIDLLLLLPFRMTIQKALRNQKTRIS